MGVKLMKDVVVNASPLILLHKIDRIELLNNLFEKVYVPIAVQNEVNYAEDTGDNNILQNLDFISITVNNQLAIKSMLGRLHIGEVEVIVGAIENSIQLVVLDDNHARNKAKQLGLDVTGNLGLLLRAYKKGIISNLEAEILKLRNAGMYIADDIIRSILKEL
jgi:predicted nucleic acid-binding protein